MAAVAGSPAFAAMRVAATQPHQSAPPPTYVPGAASAGSSASNGLAPSAGALAVASAAAVAAAGTLAAKKSRRVQRRQQRAGRELQSIVARRQASTEAASGTAEVAALADEFLLGNYGKRGLCFERGEGQYLFDAEGKKYLDFTAGIAVNCLGHSDPGWVDVVAAQAGTLVHTSNLYLNSHQAELGAKLVRSSFADKAFFCNSGTEANEAAIKFARKVHFLADKPRECFVAFESGFHGRTMGALALTWKEAYKTPFQPIMPSVDFLKFNSTEGFEKITEETCAVFVEPMQGEGGVVPATKEFLSALRKRCDEVGALLIFDEVQCGLGRSGELFGYELSGVTPDIMTLAKPLAGGLPVGAVLMTEQVASAIKPGEHGSTFAGSPLVCAAANYTFDRVSDPAFLANVRAMGDRLREGLQPLAEARGLTVRGAGLLNAIVFPDAEGCGAVLKAAQEEGLLVLTAGAGNVLRLAPALTVGAEEVDQAVAILGKALEKTLPK